MVFVYELWQLPEFFTVDKTGVPIKCVVEISLPDARNHDPDVETGMDIEKFAILFVKPLRLFGLDLAHW
jgi:hypothetical protein